MNVGDKIRIKHLNKIVTVTNRQLRPYSSHHTPDGEHIVKHIWLELDNGPYGVWEKMIPALKTWEIL